MIYDKEDFSFKIDDIEYVRWCRSGSASRQGKCFFINKELVHTMNLFTDCGINPIAVNDMREWFDKGLIDIQSNDLLEEMKTFVAEDNGAFNAVVGSHDDLVSACWLCIAGMKSAFWYPF